MFRFWQLESTQWIRGLLMKMAFLMILSSWHRCQSHFSSCHRFSFCTYKQGFRRKWKRKLYVKSSTDFVHCISQACDDKQWENGHLFLRFCNLYDLLFICKRTFKHFYRVVCVDYMKMFVFLIFMLITYKWIIFSVFFFRKSFIQSSFQSKLKRSNHFFVSDSIINKANS